MFDLKFVVSLILCIKCGVIYPTKNSLRLGLGFKSRRQVAKQILGLLEVDSIDP